MEYVVKGHAAVSELASRGPAPPMSVGRCRRLLLNEITRWALGLDRLVRRREARTAALTAEHRAGCPAEGHRAARKPHLTGSAGGHVERAVANDHVRRDQLGGAHQSGRYEQQRSECMTIEPALAQFVDSTDDRTEPRAAADLRVTVALADQRMPAAARRRAAIRRSDAVGYVGSRRGVPAGAQCVPEDAARPSAPEGGRPRSRWSEAVSCSARWEGFEPPAA
jgi:hypothetical protein